MSLLSTNLLASTAPSLFMAIPFALLLLAIALMPFINRHFWEHHYPKIAIGLGLIPTLYYFLVLRDPHPWYIAMEEYFGFIVLLAALYVIAGGIVIRVNGRATPLANSILLLLGAILANVFGTTGASMLLIRPYIHMNRARIRPYHIIFFIFIVANCGGLLTPIGDPPLFLGYLQGIPFKWTLDHLWPIWAIANGFLLVVFFIFDTLQNRRTRQPEHISHNTGPLVHVLGTHNFIFIAVVIFAVFRPGIFETAERVQAFGWSLAQAMEMLLSREVLMIFAALASQRLTAKELYRHNEFGYAPIREVAILFLGIFATMAPALGWLEANAQRLQIRTPTGYYYATGVLSSGLDNAPTYLTFLKMQLGTLDENEVAQAREATEQMRQTRSLSAGPANENRTVQAALATIVADHPEKILDGTLNDDQIRVSFLLGNEKLNLFIIAVSAGAVLFGAATYIGNGPNFMVKSIAESANIPMPGFAGYVARYSLPILVPMYIVIWLIFLL